MKNKIIYIIRHGQTDYNLKKIVQGRGVNSHLNETGMQQAQQFYDSFKGTHFDKIYTSSLVRTKESVDNFIKDGVPYEELAGLDEISWGVNEGLPYDELRHGEYLQGLSEWKNGNSNYRVAGGESPEEVALRQKEAIDQLMKREEEEVILIATHGRAMRILVCWMTNSPLNKAEEYEHSNLCLYKLMYNGQEAKILIKNSTKHIVNI